MILLPVTLISAGTLAILNFALAMRVGKIRHGERILLGHGGNEALERRMRAHANFVEYAPLVLALVGLVEFTAGPHAWFAAVAALFVLGRVFHAIGMEGPLRLRVAGTVITYMVMVGLGLYAIALPLTSVRPGREAPPTSPVAGA